METYWIIRDLVVISYVLLLCCCCLHIQSRWQYLEVCCVMRVIYILCSNLPTPDTQQCWQWPHIGLFLITRELFKVLGSQRPWPLIFPPSCSKWKKKKRKTVEMITIGSLLGSCLHRVEPSSNFWCSSELLESVELSGGCRAASHSKTVSCRCSLNPCVTTLKSSHFMSSSLLVSSSSPLAATTGLVSFFYFVCDDSECGPENRACCRTTSEVI